MKGSSMIRVENDTLVIIRASYCLAFGSPCAAALVNLYSFWHDINLAKFEQQKEFNKVARQGGEAIKRGYGLLQKHKQADLVANMQGVFTKHEIVAANKSLVEMGVITIHKNPNKGYNFDRTNFFLFHPKRANMLITKSHIETIHCPHTDNGETTDGQWSNPIRTSNNIDNNIEDNSIEESAHTQIFSDELQDKEKATEPQAAPQPYLNANAPKTYKSHLEIYNTLVAFWKANPEYTETINLMIEPLGMGSQFPNKRKAFFDHVENIFCTSIKKNQKTPLSAFELHDIIVQKIAYGKAELSELKPLGGKEEAKEKKMAEIKNKPFISEEEESIIVAYCQERTGYSYTTSKEFRECQDLKAQRIYLQAKSNIENTKKYLISKNLIAA